MYDEWQERIPVISKNHALVVFICNCVLPSLGTFLMVCATGKPYRNEQILVGCLQILTIPLLLFGYFWSVWWGYLCYTKAQTNVDTYFASPVPTLNLNNRNQSPTDKGEVKMNDIVLTENTPLGKVTKKDEPLNTPDENQPNNNKEDINDFHNINKNIKI